MDSAQRWPEVTVATMQRPDQAAWQQLHASARGCAAATHLDASADDSSISQSCSSESSITVKAAVGSCRVVLAKN
jgi:hypothetical protein